MSSQTTTSPDPADEAAFQRALAAARAGQAPGFEWLWRRFSRQVTAFARLRGSDDPEGLANDVFAGAFRQIARFEGPSSSFVGFLFALARNKVIDELRRRGRRVAFAEAEVDGEAQDRRPNADGNHTTQSAENVALAGLLPETAAALGRLTDEQREIIILRLVADLPIEEVARVTGRSVGAVKAMQHRALASMRTGLSRGAVSR